MNAERQRKSREEDAWTWVKLGKWVGYARCGPERSISQQLGTSASITLRARLHQRRARSRIWLSAEATTASLADKTASGFGTTSARQLQPWSPAVDRINSFNRPLFDTGASSHQTHSANSCRDNHRPMAPRAGIVSVTLRYVPWTLAKSRYVPSRAPSITPPDNAASTEVITLKPSIHKVVPARSPGRTNRDARPATARSPAAERSTASRCRATRR